MDNFFGARAAFGFFALFWLLRFGGAARRLADFLRFADLLRFKARTGVNFGVLSLWR